MMPASKHGDPQLGVDIHLCVVPPSPSPVPLPTPHTSIVFDPFDYIPLIGATVTVCGMKRATAGTNGIAIHIPPGFPFAPKLPDKDDELFMGSATVVADGDPFSFIALPVLSCQVAGMMSPFRPKKKGGIKAMVLPTVFNLAIPTTVFVGGPPTISLMGMAFKGAFAALGKFAKSGLFKRIRQKLFKNMKPGFLKCKVLRAEPVNILTGEVVVEQEDFTLPGRLPLEWVRSYTSGNTREGACGHGWETIADTRLEVDPLDGTVCLRHPTVGPLYFERLPVSPGDEGHELELMDGARLSDHGDELRVRTKEDGIYHFPKALAAVNALGVTEYPLGRIADLCGNWLELERRNGEVSAIIESAGRRIDIVREQGRIREVALVVPGTDVRHAFVRYEYDAEGDLVAAVDALGHPYRYAYRDHHLVQHTDRRGLSFYYEYDTTAADGWRVVHSWGDGGLYDYRFVYDDVLRERRITDSLGHVSIVTLDGRGLPIAEIDPLGGLTSYEYDECARTTAITDSDGRRTGYEYDERGNLIAVIRPDGTRISFAYNGDDKVTAITDPNGATWLQRWDERALLREQITPRGHASRYEYDALGMLQKYVDPRGVVIRTVHDAFGRLVRLTDGDGFATTFEHDVLSRIVTRTDPSQRRTHYGYDSKGRLTAVTLPSGHVLRCSYDEDDNLIEFVDRNGAVTRLEYVGLGEIGRRIQPDGQVVEYLYNTEEHLVGLRNQRGEVYRLRRDGLGRIVEEVDYWGQTRQFIYTAGGQLRRSIDPLGRAIDYETDPLGRVLSKRMAAPWAGAEVWEERFVYDANGNVIGASNPHVRIEREFDAESQLVREAQHLRSGEQFTVFSRYDEAGNRVERRTEIVTSGGPGPGHVVRWAYDRLNQAVSVSVDGQAPRRIVRDGTMPVEAELAPGLSRKCLYDDEGRLIGQAVTRGEERLFLTRFDYDDADNLRRRLDTQYGSEQFAYDPLGRVLRHTDPAGRVHRFLHDPGGDRWQAAGAASEGTALGTWNRMASVDGVTFQFDAAGNVVRRTASDADLELEWDAEHRLAVSRRVRQGDAAPVVTRYAYDPFGRRMFKETGGLRTWFGWDGDTLIFDCEQAAVTSPPHDSTQEPPTPSPPVLAREFLYEPETFEPVMFLLQRPQEHDRAWSQQCLHFVNDPNGCPVRTLDDSGTVQWAVSYSAWGEVLGEHVRGTANPLRLQGQYADPETGLYYNRHRYYDPHAGAFVGQDPVGIEAGCNLYELGPNVFGWIDPLGLTDCMVTVYRVQPRGRRSVMGGAYLRAREAGKTVVEALGVRKKLMDAVNSSDPKKRVRALQDAQASGRKSPFISTTLNEDLARRELAAARAAGRDVELVIIRGPRDKGMDFESEFARLGGRTSPARAKDAAMEEFGIPDVFVPESGKSASGFEIIGRD